MNMKFITMLVLVFGLCIFQLQAQKLLELTGNLTRLTMEDSTIADSDTTPPINATSVTIDTNGTDSIDVVIVFGGQTDISSIRVQSDTSSITSRTQGTNRYAGSDTSVANSITFAHGFTDTDLIYVRVYLSDASGNWNTGTEENYRIPDMTSPNAGTLIATYDSTSTFNAIIDSLTYGDSTDVDGGILEMKISSGDWFTLEQYGDTTITKDTLSLWAHYYNIKDDSLFFRWRVYDEVPNYSAYALDTIPKAANYVTADFTTDSTFTALTFFTVFLRDAAGGTPVDSIGFSKAKLDSVNTDSFKVYLDTMNIVAVQPDTTWISGRPVFDTYEGIEGDSFAWTDAAAAGDSYNDLVLFWRCEGTTLGGDDTYGTDNTATLNSIAAINTDAVNIGTNGLDSPSALDNAQFDNNGEYVVVDGRYGAWVRFTDLTDNLSLFYFASAGDDNAVFLQVTGTDELTLTHDAEFQSPVTLTSTDANLSTGTWFFIEAKWNDTADSLQILVNNTSRGISTATLNTWTGAVTKVVFGDAFGITQDAHYDNIMLSDSSARSLYPLRNLTVSPK